MLGKGVREPVPPVTEGDISVDDERERTEILRKDRSRQGGGCCDGVTLTLCHATKLTSVWLPSGLLDPHTVSRVYCVQNRNREV